jgi:hypothetical protein
MNTKTPFQQKALDSALETLRDLFKNPNIEEKDYEKASAEVQRLQALKKKEEDARKVKKWNEKETKRRNTLRSLLALQLPAEDITNMDGSIHGTKGRKVAGLMELNKELWRLTLKYNATEKIYTEASVSGERFYLLRPVYEYRKPDAFVPFASFENACDYNGIRPEPITVAKATKNAQRIKAEAKKLEELLSKYSATLKALESRDIVEMGLITQRQGHHYEYY